MPLPLTEHNAVLALKGVGPAVITAIELAKDSQLSTPGA